MDTARLDRRFRLGLCVAAALFAALRALLDSPPAWVNAAFIITTAGMVGYFTNFLAIRMLFQPKRGRVLGWEGLVPKNQSQIAASLAESVQTQLLAPDIILDYLHEYRLIDRATGELSRWLDRQLRDPEFRRALTRSLIDWLHEQGPAMLETLLDGSETLLTGVARDPAQVEQYWRSIREILEEYLADQGNREVLATRLQRLLLEEMPAIAQKIDDALEDYLRSQNARGTIGMSVKKVLAFDEQSIERALISLIQDGDSSGRVMGVMDRLADQLLETLRAPRSQQVVQDHLESWVRSAAAFSRRSVLPRGIAHLQTYLDNPDNWETIERQILAVLERAKATLLRFVDSDRGQRVLRRSIESAVRRINVTQLVEQQVMSLDTDELEAMILNNTGGNLVLIQTLGGGLGLVAGLVQVHMGFAIPLLFGVVIVWVAFRLNQRRYRRV